MRAHPSKHVHRFYMHYMLLGVLYYMLNIDMQHGWGNVTDEERRAPPKMMNAAAVLYCFKQQNCYIMLFLHASSSHSRKTISVDCLFAVSSSTPL